MKRREFITLLGGATGWPLAARAQQPAKPVIGLLHPASPDEVAFTLRAFRQGLKDTGYVEGENVAIEYRWAENQTDRLPGLVAELVRKQVAVIATPISGALTAKTATTTIPIVFVAGEDPVRLGLVASLARPGSNLTGISFFNTELAAKRLELLRELVDGAARVAVLINPANPATAETTLEEVQAVAHAIGLQLQVLKASTSRGIGAAFAPRRGRGTSAVAVRHGRRHVRAPPNAACVPKRSLKNIVHQIGDRLLAGVAYLGAHLLCVVRLGPLEDLAPLHGAFPLELVAATRAAPESARGLPQVVTDACRWSAPAMNSNRHVRGSRRTPQSALALCSVRRG